MATRPLTPGALRDELADRVAALPPGARVLVDAAPAAGPDALADDLVDRLHRRSRPVLRVSAWDFLRPASVRLERGREDPDAFYDDWLDAGALLREVLRPAAAGRPVLPALWDAGRDRAYGRPRVEPPAGVVVVVDGALLLGRGLPSELTVHLDLSTAALGRRVAPAWAWTLPAYARYRAEVDPVATADLVVRADHPDRPALRTRD